MYLKHLDLFIKVDNIVTAIDNIIMHV